MVLCLITFGFAHPGIPYDYEYPPSTEWYRDIELTYCISPCENPLDVQITEPRYAMVSERLAYCYIGEFEKIGDLYSYYTRYTLIDLETGSIVAWYMHHAGAGEKTYNTSNGIKQGAGFYYVPDQDYPFDANGYRICVTSSNAYSLLDIDDNYNWGGTAVICNFR